LGTIAGPARRAGPAGVAQTRRSQSHQPRLLQQGKPAGDEDGGRLSWIGIGPSAAGKRAVLVRQTGDFRLNDAFFFLTKRSRAA